MNWQQIQALAHSELANPLDTLARINKAMDMALDGCLTEKATAKGESVEVLEKSPGIIAQLVRSQLEVLKYIDSQVDTAPVTGCQLVIGDWYEEVDVNSNRTKTDQ